VHHGGAGTTAAGLRAGKPSAVVGFFGDQMFWGGRVAATGAGPAPIERRRISQQALTGALRAIVDDAGMHAAAQRAAAQIAREDGVAETVRRLSATLSARRAPAASPS